MRLLAAVATASLSLSLPLPGGAAELRDVRLKSGRSLQAREAELRDGRWHLVLVSGLTMSLPEGEVRSVREVASERRLDGLNFVEGSGGGAGASRPLLPAAGSADDRALFDAVAELRAGRRHREAEALLRGELVERPGDDLRLILLGRVLVDAGRFGEALEPLGLAAPSPESSLRRERDLALAEALSRLDRVEEAQAVLAATPEDAAGEVAGFRARLERDRTAGEGLEALSTPRFLIRLPPTERRLDVRPLVELLDAAWDELERGLGGTPRERVVVLIQPGHEFWESTGMGRNVGGLYDGKVRVPAGRLSPPSPRLAAVLRHELAHAFVDALSGGRADAVWQEGIAEHFERSPLRAELERQLAERFETGQWPPAYDHATAHSRLEWFLGRWGMAGLRDLLREWDRRGSLSAACVAVTGLEPSELEEAWGRALADAGAR